MWHSVINYHIMLKRVASLADGQCLPYLHMACTACRLPSQILMFHLMNKSLLFKLKYCKQ
jgi:hypothetical protein